MGRQQSGISILSLQRMLEIKTYKTVWTMGHKIRQAMAERDANYQLAGPDDPPPIRKLQADPVKVNKGIPAPNPALDIFDHLKFYLIRTVPADFRCRNAAGEVCQEF